MRRKKSQSLRRSRKKSPSRRRRTPKPTKRQSFRKRNNLRNHKSNRRHKPQTATTFFQSLIQPLIITPQTTPPSLPIPQTPLIPPQLTPTPQTPQFPQLPLQITLPPPTPPPTPQTPQFPQLPLQITLPPPTPPPTPQTPQFPQTPPTPPTPQFPLQITLPPPTPPQTPQTPPTPPTPQLPLQITLPPPTPPQTSPPAQTQLRVAPIDTDIFSLDEIDTLQKNTSVAFINNSLSCHIDSVLITLFSMESNVFRLSLLTTPDNQLNQLEVSSRKPNCRVVEIANNLRSDARKLIFPGKINTCHKVRKSMGECIDSTFASQTVEADKSYSLLAEIFPALHSQLEVCSHFEKWEKIDPKDKDQVPTGIIGSNCLKVNNTFDLITTWISFISPENWQKLLNQHTTDDIRSIMTLFSNLDDFSGYEQYNIQEVINDPKLLLDAVTKSKTMKNSAYTSPIILEIPDWSKYTYDQITFTSTPSWFIGEYFDRLDSFGAQKHRFKEQSLDFEIVLPNKRQYELQGVILFIDLTPRIMNWVTGLGERPNGHYVSIIKTQKLGWVLYDDTKRHPFEQLSMPDTRDYAFSVVKASGTKISVPVMWFYTFVN